MPKIKIPALEYIRGLSMLGVLGIHTGAFSLSNPHVNIHLFAFLDILTRFSVPIFFFVSAFGLFWGQNLSLPFHYGSFLLRRSRSVLIPYLTWSLLYMLHYTWISGDTQIWFPPLVYEYFCFGLASYQLYFLVILLWFYALMPLWRILVRGIVTKPILWLSLLLVLQIAFNYYSSYVLQVTTVNHYLQKILEYRLSYWVFHYIFIFLLGAVCALNYEVFKKWLIHNQTAVKIFFYVTLAGMLGLYYYLIYFLAYTPEEAVNIDHQLSPIGVLYTLASCLYWFNLFNNIHLSVYAQKIFAYFGKHSYFVYLVHPFVMYYLTIFLEKYNLLMTFSFTIFFYLAALSISLLLSFGVVTIGRIFPIIPLVLQGQTKR